MSDVAPTHSALLALREERQVVHEGYDFLDEKCMLLAAEALRQLDRFEQLLSGFRAEQAHATSALADAVARHGLQGMACYPPNPLEGGRVSLSTRSFLGVTLAESTLEIDVSAKKSGTPANPSPEAEQCRQIFAALLTRAAQLAGISGNLHRLLLEYRRTERRARALEDVVLPELEACIREMTMRLEEIEQEEAIKVRWSYRR